MRILGLDPSLTNLGYVVLEEKEILEKGRLQTGTEHGLNIQRFLIQANSVGDLIRKYNIKYVAVEQPVFDAFSSELLFALQQFLHLIYWSYGLKVVGFDPRRVKSYALPGFKGKIEKRDMVAAAKSILGMDPKKRLANDVADAFWIATLGIKWWSFYEGIIKESDLTEQEHRIFLHQHTYTRGKKKGLTEKNGILFRENELYYVYDKLPRPALNLGENYG